MSTEWKPPGVFPDRDGKERSNEWYEREIQRRDQELRAKKVTQEDELDASSVADKLQDKQARIIAFTEQLNRREKEVQELSKLRFDNDQLEATIRELKEHLVSKEATNVNLAERLASNSSVMDGYQKEIQDLKDALQRQASLRRNAESRDSICTKDLKSMEARIMNKLHDLESKFGVQMVTLEEADVFPDGLYDTFRDRLFKEGGLLHSRDQVPGWVVDRFLEEKKAREELSNKFDEETDRLEFKIDQVFEVELKEQINILGGRIDDIMEGMEHLHGLEGKTNKRFTAIDTEIRDIRLDRDNVVGSFRRATNDLQGQESRITSLEEAVAKPIKEKT